VSGASADRLEPNASAWTPIEWYGVIGDGRTVALIARDGNIDWLPMPDLDSPPAFAAILDPEHGGRICLQPDQPFETEHRYLPDTNVLETTFVTPTGRLRLTDALTVGMGGRLPWNELVRHAEVLSGDVSIRWTVEPGRKFGSAAPWTQSRDGGSRLTLHCGDEVMGLRAFGLGEPMTQGSTIGGGAQLSAGQSGVLGLTSSDAGQVWLPNREELEDRLERTVDRWREWAATVNVSGRWAEKVRRSALALKLLIFAPTGAIAAAGTTSLPERIGGDKNWDYRYMWVRDAAFTADAFMSLDLYEEVHACVAWLLKVISESSPDIHVMYTLRGEVARRVTELNAPGYLNSRPVRSGNDATTQRQLGTFGDLFDTVWTYVRRNHVLDSRTGRMLSLLADRCCDVWETADSGIWELNQQRHYTISKIGCWVALDRAVKLHGAGQIACTHPGRWRAERDRIKHWVNRNCWSTVKQSYTFYSGTDDLDAAVLLAGQTGFDRGDRLAGTVRAVTQELASGPLVWRYTGAKEEEGGFLACTFWLITAMCWSGQKTAAGELMDRAVDLTNDLGLFSEQMSSGSTLLGNIPQGLSHLALVNAATALNEMD